jgi:hypothetical protein
VLRMSVCSVEVIDSLDCDINIREICKLLFNDFFVTQKCCLGSLYILRCCDKTHLIQ